MRSGASFVSLLLFIICIFVDCMAFAFYQTLGGALMLVSTIFVFAAGHIWFVHRGDQKLYIKNKGLIIPIFLICFTFIQVFGRYHREEGFEPENLLSLGQMIMARYQGALWAIGTLIVCIFVLSASLLEKGRD